MAAAFILFVFFSSTSGVTMHEVRFANQAACQAAANDVHTTLSAYPNASGVVAYCEPASE